MEEKKNPEKVRSRHKSSPVVLTGLSRKTQYPKIDIALICHRHFFLPFLVALRK